MVRRPARAAAYITTAQPVATINRARAPASDRSPSSGSAPGASPAGADGNAVTFYEIDPLVVRIAQDWTASFLSKCAPNAPIVIGDARFLADAPDGPTTSSSWTRSPPTPSRSI
jgi:hypothetical protein